MITSSNFNISLQVGPREGGGTENKKNKANHRPTKTCASGGARFFEPKSKKGQLAWLKFSAEGGTKAPPSHSKNDITNNIKKKFKGEVRQIFAEFQRYHEGEKPSKP